MPHSVIRIIFTTQSQSEHQLTISLDNIQLKKLEIPANEQQTHTVEYGIEYSKARYKSLLFDWQGTECEQKTLHVESITLDNKPVKAYFNPPWIIPCEARVCPQPSSFRSKSIAL